MGFSVIYKPLAQLEARETYQWYSRPDIGMGDAFLTGLEHTDHFISDNPYLYPKVEGKMRRANLSRFPFSLFYVIDGEEVNVLSCFHPYRDPKSRDDLLNSN